MEQGALSIELEARKFKKMIQSLFAYNESILITNQDKPNNILLNKSFANMMRFLQVSGVGFRVSGRQRVAKS